MKKKFFILSVMVIVFSGVPAFAETAKSKTGGITISPAAQDIILKQDQKTLEGSFAITNNSQTPESFELVTVDMGALDDTGGLVFSGLSQDYQHKYGLAQWLELSRKTVAIKPHGKEVVTFAVKNEASLSPGGHYGAVVVRRVANQTSVPDQRIALSPQAASLIFLRKVGGEVYGLSLQHITSNHSIWQRPTKVNLPFKNEGNVHIVPRGIVRLKNTFGKEIARGIINPESALVLPERSRTLTVGLSQNTQVVWPGRYTLEVMYRYDGQDQMTSASQTFYTANLRVFLLLIGLLLAILFVGYTTRKRVRRAVVSMRRRAGKLLRKLSQRKHS